MRTASLRAVSDVGGRYCLNTVRVAAVAVLALALAVICGYLFRFDTVITLKTGLQGMSLLTATAIVDLSLAVLAQSWGKAQLARIGGSIAAIGGFAVLMVHVIDGADTLSPVLAGAFGFSPDDAARVSIATAVCVCTLGLAILAASRAVVADVLALVVTLITSFALLGYAYGVHELYALPLFQTMALHTAAALLLLSLVSILGRPQSNWCAVIGARTEAGAATRRQILFMAVPIVVGWSLLRAIHLAALGPAAAMALLVIATVTSLVVLILRDGRRVVELDAERQSKLDMQDALNAEMNERLKLQEQEILDRTAQQAQAQATVFKAQRLEALSRLTGGIAHDFNNVLQAISGSVELIGRRSRDGRPIDSLLNGVRTATERGAKLGSQLLAFSRVQKLNIRPLPLDQLIANSQTILGAAVGSAITIRYDLRATGQVILADDAQFELALLNLALNARDAMQGSGELAVATSLRDTAATPAHAAEPIVSVRMTDNGDGMNAEVLERAAEPFFSTKAVGTASGLGLAQVQGFMAQCRGEMTISSAPQAGTTVELLFPTVRQVAPPAPAPDPDDDACAGSASAHPLIVVVEDDEVVRRVIVDGLKETGYEVAEAGDGDEGVAQIKGRRPAAAVIDFLMPKLTGAEVAQMARAEQPDLPIVFMSGHFETAALEKFDRAVILRKPFELDDLRSTLKAVLQG
jgi:signal transduction histidine kinase